MLIESTGVADPESLLQKFWLDAELESNLLLDGVVCVVDVARIQGILSGSSASD